MGKTAEQFALNLKSDIDYGLLLWTFESLDEDTELEKFFKRLTRLCDSDIGNILNLKQGIIVPHKKLSSTKTIESIPLLEPWWILCCVLFGDWYRFLGYSPFRWCGVMNVEFSWRAASSTCQNPYSPYTPHVVTAYYLLAPFLSLGGPFKCTPGRRRITEITFLMRRRGP